MDILPENCYKKMFFVNINTFQLRTPTEITLFVNIQIDLIILKRDYSQLHNV